MKVLFLAMFFAAIAAWYAEHTAAKRQRKLNAKNPPVIDRIM